MKRLYGLIFVLLCVLFFLQFKDNRISKKHEKRKMYDDSLINSMNWSTYPHKDSPYGGKAERRRYYHNHPHNN